MTNSSIAQRFAGFSKVLVAVIVVLLIAATLLFLNNGDGKRYLTVDFDQTNSVYKGSEVKILGVKVGTVESLTPRGQVVRVKIAYDGQQKLPADVKAVVVSPSIVGDRFIQLAPAYDGGATLKDDAFLPVERTAVPVELDAVYQSLDDLSVALGPKDGAAEGPLSQLVDGTAAQLDGQGAQLNETLKNFGKLSTTLSNNKDELFGGLREVNDFVTLLKTNDQSVRAFNDSTAEVSTVLAGERDDLAGTLEALSKALVDVNGLVKENRSALRGNVDNIASLANVLAQRKDELEQATIAAPTALSNVALAYNGTTGTLDTRADIPELISGTLGDPAGLLCNILGQAPTETGCSALTDLLGGLTGGLTGGAATPGAASTDLPRAAAASTTPAPRIEKVNSSVADMLAVQ
ncbi:MCE family protein [Aeromicrobium fastidiosum]|uniref:MCE family protein n=1 Tax=Aeromicrobium fastidiosum TaxID=52699 RepID=UPI0020237A19|nr:MCE family protein [Aeromicrobium fastidiosum]MCL8251984.1 MCE family protein [Aeromicrobium fastidiosum]